MLKANKITRDIARRNKLDTARYFASTRPVDTREATPDAIQNARQIDYTLTHRYSQSPVTQEAAPR